MAPAQLHLVFLTIFLRLITAQHNDGSVSLGALLTAAPNVTPWLSSSGEFAFGFQQVQGIDNFLLSIWYDKIPDKTIIWYPKEGLMVPTGSKVELTGGSGLVLSDPQGTEVWRSGSISAVHQVMEIGGGMNSTISATNFSGGRFQLRFQQDGNLVLSSRDILSGNAYGAYDSSGTADATNSTNIGEKVIYDAMGYIYILKRSGERFGLSQRDTVPSGDYYHRATLDYDGVFRQYYHPKNATGNTSWEVILSMPENICNISMRMDSGACGYNNVCSLDGNRRKCECPQGFSLLDPNNPSGDCKPDFTPKCDQVESNNIDFIELDNIDWPESDYEHMDPSNEDTCKSSCLEDCFCAVATYSNNQCWKKRFPLSNGRMTPGVKPFVKYRIGDIPLQSPPRQNPFRLPGEKKDRRSLIVVGSVLLATSVFVIFVLIGMGFFVIYKKKPRNTYSISQDAETNLPRFTYHELVEATDGFKDELGKGAFGTVYKEIISCRKSLVYESDEKGVAVLTDLAWDCYEEGRLDTFVDNDLEALDDYKKLATFVMVGLWCVQENSSLRPTMRKVIQMLEGGIEVAEPPCPCSFSVTSY
ncbi:unnamed protein product [Lactuca virosa]|uniref:Bulb-type lectin domain-containing protein n=1 Tax=Lactuca virosa TaxID=75947 RepID=A0AAU9NUW2_9ASTR|nr:unnamed protein product [Lactuca virosa]